MPSGCRHYAFTCNNYTEGDIDSVAKASSDDQEKSKRRIDYLFYGKEVAASGTPHLQGQVSFNKQTSVKKALKILGVQAHLSPTRNAANSVECCKKEGQWMDFGAPHTVTASGTPSGKRSDLVAFKKAVKEDGLFDKKTLRDQHSEVAAHCGRFFHDYVNDWKPKPEIERHPLRLFQQRSHEDLKRPPNDRTITFIVDQIGNSGKTWFAKQHFRDHDDSHYMEPGKKADMAHAMPDATRVLFVDCTREQCEHLNYSFLEACKNGIVFVGKYE